MVEGLSLTLLDNQIQAFERERLSSFFQSSAMACRGGLFTSEKTRTRYLMVHVCRRHDRLSRYS